MRHRIIQVLFLAGLLAIVQAQEVVNVYTARHYPSDEGLYERFTELTGIKVQFIEGDSDELIARMQSEGANGPADVFITVDAGRMWRAEEAGLLAPLSSTFVDDAAPSTLRHPQGLWVSLAQRVRGFVTSVDRVEEGAITTYEELADPAWEGRVCIRSSGNIYNQSLLASLIASIGPEAAEAWAAGVVGNMARAPQGGDTDQIRAVATGECDVAVVNHYYLARLMASSDTGDHEVANAVRWVLPNQADRGAHVNVSAAGIVSTAPHPENALAFIEFLLTTEAQEVFAAGNHEYPVVEGATTSDVADRFGPFRSDAVNVSLYGENNPEAIRIFDRVGWR